MTDEVAKTVLVNALRELPGTRNWVRIPEVAQRLILRIKEAGGVITFPEGEPDIKEVSHIDRAFRDLVDMDRRDRSL